MVVMCKLSHGESFVLKVNEPHFYLLLFSSAMNLRFMTFTLCCEHGGFYHLQKVRGLRWTDEISPVSSHGSHPGSAPPTSLDPCLPRHQVLGSVLIRFPCRCLHSSPSCLHSSPSCLHSSLSCSSPSQKPPFHQKHTFRKQLQVLRQTGFFAICPPQPFQLFPTPTWCPAVLALWGSFHTPICLYILVPLSRTRKQRARAQKDSGRWDLPIPSCSSRGRPCPLSSHSPKWVHLTIYESPCHP